MIVAQRIARWLVVGALAATPLTACAVNQGDVERWATTQHGPKKLVAVVIHDKYPVELRVAAALELAGMAPRDGKRIGLLGLDSDPENMGLVKSMLRVNKATRAKLMAGLVPGLVAAMKAPPADAGDGPVEDISGRYKDAAFALLTTDPELVEDPAMRKQLGDALVLWCTTDLENKVRDASHYYSVEQVLRALQADGARPLPALMKTDSRVMGTLAKIVADVGDEATKLEASQRLVTIATDVDSPAWRERQTPVLQAANTEAGVEVSPEAFQIQLTRYQSQTLEGVFTSMRSVGGVPVVEYLLTFAGNAEKEDELRAKALVALEGHLDKKDQAHADRLLAIARDEKTPDIIRDQAFRRIGEFPRKMVAAGLFPLLQSERLQLRNVAGSLLMKLSDQSNIDEFLKALETVKGLSMTEVYSFGSNLGEIGGGVPPAQRADELMKPAQPIRSRLVGVGYYMAKGDQTHVAALTSLKSDTTAIPACEGEGCEWNCVVGEGEKRETKTAKTLGEFVDFCVLPMMNERKPADAAPPAGAAPSGSAAPSAPPAGAAPPPPATSASAPAP